MLMCECTAWLVYHVHWGSHACSYSTCILTRYLRHMWTEGLSLLTSVLFEQYTTASALHNWLLAHLNVRGIVLILVNTRTVHSVLFNQLCNKCVYAVLTRLATPSQVPSAVKALYASPLADVLQSSPLSEQKWIHSHPNHNHHEQRDAQQWWQRPSYWSNRWQHNKFVCDTWHHQLPNSTLHPNECLRNGRKSS